MWRVRGLLMLPRLAWVTVFLFAFSCVDPPERGAGLKSLPVAEPQRPAVTPGHGTEAASPSPLVPVVSGRTEGCCERDGSVAYRECQEQEGTQRVPNRGLTWERMNRILEVYPLPRPRVARSVYSRVVKA